MRRTISDELARRQQDARNFGRQAVQLSNEGAPMFLRHSAMQHKRGRLMPIQQCCEDSVEVLGPFGQYENLAALWARTLDFGYDGVGALLIIGQVTEHILNPGLGWQVDPREA